MTREEAMEIVEKLYNDSLFLKKDKEAIQTLIPELRESEDEKIREELREELKSKLPFCSEEFTKHRIIRQIAYLEKQKEQPTSAIDVFTRAGLKPYKDGNQWCILAGDNIQEGICGFGDTIEDALFEFLKEVIQVGKKPMEWSEDYREKDIQTRFAFYTYKDDPSVLYLSNVFVEETSRNKGFGTKILQATEKVAGTVGANTIRLKVKQNSPANVWYHKNGYGYMTFEDGYDWLEKNLEYMKPTKREWSEEDEYCRNLLIVFCENCMQQDSAAIRCANWLKSLRPSWKPSEEQMEVLRKYVIGEWRDLTFGQDKNLTSLYNDLKKLM